MMAEEGWQVEQCQIHPVTEGPFVLTQIINFNVFPKNETLIYKLYNIL